MITCKEDLMNTYIVNDKGALRDAYLAICGKFNLHNLESEKFKAEFYADSYIVCNSYSLPTSEWLLQSHASADDSILSRVVMSDLKPTRTEYVKVTDSIFDLKADFEKGELYEKDSGYCKLISESDFAFAYRENAIYRKVEREITWQDELERLYPVNAINGHVSFKQLITYEQFIEMCHKVYHLTK